MERDTGWHTKSGRNITLLVIAYQAVVAGLAGAGAGWIIGARISWWLVAPVFLAVALLVLFVITSALRRWWPPGPPPGYRRRRLC